MNLCFCFMNDRIETILLIRTMEFFNNSNDFKSKNIPNFLSNLLSVHKKISLC